MPNLPQTASPAPVSLITGAGSGIGHHTARLLALAHHRLVLVGRTTDTLEATGQLLSDAAHAAHAPAPQWLAVQADITDPDDVREMLDAALERFGRLDNLINNAGWSPLVPLAGCDPDTIDEIFRVNALGPLYATAAALPHFIRQGSGCVINISSMATADPFPGLGVYGSAKASVNLLARAILNETRALPARIRAFSIAPGAVETPLLRSLFSEATLPNEHTLAPEAVARVIVDCIEGRRDSEVGQTIFIPSP